MPVLTRALTHERDSVRRVAALALGDHGPAAKGSVKALGELLMNDESEPVARACAEALGRIGESAAAELRTGLEHEDPTVREAVAAALKLNRSKDIP